MVIVSVKYFSCFPLLIIFILDEDKKYAVETISTLLNLIKAKDTAKHDDIKRCADTLLPKLFQAIITASLDETNDNKKTILVSDEVLQIIYLIITNVVKNMNTLYVYLTILSPPSN